MSATDAPDDEQKAWIAARFVLFGVVGLLVMTLSLFVFVIQLFEGVHHIPSFVLSLPLSVVGGLMILYGVGEWGRWAYIWVFLSIPISLGLVALLASRVSAVNHNAGLPLIFVAVVAFLTYGEVRAYYNRRTRKDTSGNTRRHSPG